MRVLNRKGFTLIEVIVVAGIIAILAGILVPMIFKEIDEAKITRASADIRSISSAMFIFRKDTGKWPVMDGTCTEAGTLLSGQGNNPSGLAAKGFDQTGESSFNNHLPQDVNGCYNNWKGPYIAIVTADPWGNAYESNIKDFATAGAPVWIISGGSDGTLQTGSPDVTVSGDDVGLRLQ